MPDAVLDSIRSQDARFNDVPDDELRAYVAQRHPELQVAPGIVHLPALDSRSLSSVDGQQVSLTLLNGLSYDSAKGTFDETPGATNVLVRIVRNPTFGTRTEKILQTPLANLPDDMARQVSKLTAVGHKSFAAPAIDIDPDVPLHQTLGKALTALEGAVDNAARMNPDFAADAKAPAAPEQDPSNLQIVELPNGRKFQFPASWDRNEMAVWLYAKVPELRVRTDTTPLEARQNMFKGLMNEVWEKHREKGYSLESMERAVKSGVGSDSKDFDFLRSFEDALIRTEVGGTSVILAKPDSQRAEWFGFAPDTPFTVSPKTGMLDFEMPVRYSPDLHPEADLPSRASLLRGTKPPTPSIGWYLGRAYDLLGL